MAQFQANQPLQFWLVLQLQIPHVSDTAFGENNNWISAFGSSTHLHQVKVTEPQGTSVLQIAAEHVNAHSQRDGLTQSRYSTVSFSAGKLVSNSEVTLGTHFFHYTNLILKFPLMKCLGGKQWRCRTVLALHCLSKAQQEILMGQTVGKGTPIVCHILCT